MITILQKKLDTTVIVVSPLFGHNPGASPGGRKVNHCPGF
jgi:hypothetical protein